MKQFLLFFGSDYYPRGGWDDFKGSFDSVQDATRSLTNETYFDGVGKFFTFDWYQVVDSKTGSVVDSGDCGDIRRNYKMDMSAQG